ncbi:MAG: nucleotidyltransferase family protein [Silicimonas sp.]|nr:nucleotidyltransferase family protein [Silicimonas sp.]
MFVVIPAAGASRRMRGRDKLNETIHGHTVLQRQTNRALCLGCPVLVCLPEGGGGREHSLTGLSVEIVNVPDAAEGLGATLRAAARQALRKYPEDAMLVLLPDVPDITFTDIQSVQAAFKAAGGKTAARATDSKNAPGTPLILPPRVWHKFTELSGDRGGREALDGEKIIGVPLKDDRATRDLDTPEDWAEWRLKSDIPD